MNEPYFKLGKDTSKWVFSCTACNGFMTVSLLELEKHTKKCLEDLEKSLQEQIEIQNDHPIMVPKGIPNIWADWRKYLEELRGGKY